MRSSFGAAGALRGFLVVAFAAASVISLSSSTQAAAAGRGARPAEVVASQDNSTWVEYRVGGDATEEHREPDVVMCSEIGDGEFSLHSMGEWVITIEAPSPELGEHEASFLLAPPHGQYRDDDARTEDRAKGTGTITLEDGGKNQMGMAILKGTFSVAELTAESGFSFTLEGSYSCVMF